MRFLKDEYGIGGRSHALSGATHSGEDHDGKGLHYKKQDCPDVHLNWEKVAKRITSLVQKDRYLTEQEQAQYDKIQSEKELAEEDAIQAQQPEMDEETPKPMPLFPRMPHTAMPAGILTVKMLSSRAMPLCAVRFLVLRIMRLYSDVPEFRQRLHRK